MFRGRSWYLEAQPGAQTRKQRKKSAWGNSAILLSMLRPFPLSLVEEQEPKKRLSPSIKVFIVVLLKQGP